MNTAFLFDTETTDLTFNRTKKIDQQPHVYEFYGCLFDFNTGVLIDEIDTLISIPIKIPAKSKKITGIDDDMLIGAPVFKEVAPRIKKLIEGAPLVIAHNMSFDREIIDIEFERLGETIKWPKVLCTVEATLHLKGFRLSLTALHDILFAKAFPEAHRAKHDVAALTRCCAELYQRGEI